MGVTVPPPPDRRAQGSGRGLALEPELLEAPAPGTAGVVADQLPALPTEAVEHGTGVALLTLRHSAGQLDAHSGALRLGVVGCDDRGVFPRGHRQTVAGDESRTRPTVRRAALEAGGTAQLSAAAARSGSSPDGRRRAGGRHRWDGSRRP